MRVSDERVVDGKECVAAVFLGHENAFRIGASRKNSVTGAESEPLQKGLLCLIVPLAIASPSFRSPLWSGHDFLCSVQKRVRIFDNSALVNSYKTNNPQDTRSRPFIVS